MIAASDTVLGDNELVDDKEVAAVHSAGAARQCCTAVASMRAAATLAQYCGE